MQPKCSPSIGLPFQSMEIFDPSIGEPSNLLPSCAEVSLAKIYPMLGREQDYEKAPEADSGLNISEPFAHYDRNISWWRTYQVSWITMRLDEFSETWPKAGMMRNGIVYQQNSLVPTMSGKGCGLWPTPRAADAKGTTSYRQTVRVLERGFSHNLAEAVIYASGMDGKLNPDWVEWLMGYPIKHTDLKDSGTPSSLK